MAAHVVPWSGLTARSRARSPQPGAATDSPPRISRRRAQGGDVRAGGRRGHVRRARGAGGARADGTGSVRRRTFERAGCAARAPRPRAPHAVVARRPIAPWRLRIAPVACGSTRNGPGNGTARGTHLPWLSAQHPPPVAQRAAPTS
eukprot:7240555-Prymnesium_polylepis.2